MNLLPFRTKQNLRGGWNKPLDRDLSTLQRDMSDFLGDFLGLSGESLPRIYDMGLYPAVDIKNESDRYLIEAELPGMKEEDIYIDIYDNVLSIKGKRESESNREEAGYFHSERYYGAFRRDIPLEEKVRTDDVTAELKKGVLHIELMKKQKRDKDHKKITIKH